jgi:hypothetical protein
MIVSGSVAATEAANQLRSASDAAPEGVAAVEDDFGLVIMPIPIANPTVGTGLALVSLFTYNLDPESPASSTALAAGMTDNGSWIAGLQQSLYWSANRYRLDLIVGRGEAHLKYFGREGGIDLSDRPIDYRLSGWFLQPRFQVRVADPWYAGVQATYLDAATGLELINALPPLELDTRLLGIGPMVNYDSRDNRFNPRQGTYAELLALRYDSRWGSDFDYDKYKFFYNRYLPVTEAMTLAARVNGVLTDGDVPFFDAPSLTLRGFPAGRYQDEQMIAAEAEARWRFADRWSVVGFVGVGKVAPDVDAFGNAPSIVSRGLGLRFLASRKEKVNIGIDYAVSPDDSAFYFRVGEAF